MTTRPLAQSVKKPLVPVHHLPHGAAVAAPAHVPVATAAPASAPAKPHTIRPHGKHRHGEQSDDALVADSSDTSAPPVLSNSADAIVADAPLAGGTIDGAGDAIAAGQGRSSEAQELFSGRGPGGTGTAPVSSAPPGMMDHIYNAAGGASGLEVLSAVGIGLGAVGLASSGSGAAAVPTAQKVLPVTAGLSSNSETGTSLTDNIINNKMPSITGNTEAGATVVVTLHGVQYSTTADANGNWTVSVPAANALPDGTYVATVKVTDSAGNIGTATASAFLVDTTLAITGDLAVSSDSGTSNSDYLTNITNPSFVGTATAGATVTMVLNSKTYTAVADATGAWVITVPARDTLTNGTYTPQVTATDVAGNSTSLSVHAITVNTSNVVTGGLDPASDSGISHTDNYTSVNLPTFSGTTSAGALVTLIVNAKSYSATADASGAWTFTLPTTDLLPDGTYIAQIRAVDVEGNAATLQTPTIHINTSVAVTGGLSYLTDSGSNSNDRITDITTPTIAGTTEAGATVVLTLHGKTYNAVANASGAWSVAIPTSDALGDGVYGMTVTATDLAGNTATANTLPFTVKTTSVFTGGLDPASDNATNSGSNTGATNSDGHTTIATPNFKGTSDASATIQLSINNKSYTTVADANGNWNIMVPAVDALAAGSYTPTFKETDLAGNVTVLNGAPLVIESGHTPTLTSVNDTVGILQGHLLSGETTDATALAMTGFVDLYSSIDGGTVTIYDGTTALGTAALNTSDGTWTYSAVLAAGSHTLTAHYTTGSGTPTTTNSAVFNLTVAPADGIYSNITTDTTNPAQHNLLLGGASRTLDLSAAAHAEIDYLDLTGTGANAVHLSVNDVLQGGVNLFNSANGWNGLVAGTRHQMVITGNANDTVLLDNASHATDWALAGTTTNAGHVYQVYNNVAGTAQLLVEQTMLHAAGGALG